MDVAERLRDPRIDLRNANIGASNGTVHTIGRVLVPVDVAPVRRAWGWRYR